MNGQVPEVQIPAGDMRVDVEVHGEVHLIRLAGQLNLSTAVALRQVALKSLADGPTAIVFDAHALSVANPAALSVFAVVSRHAGERGADRCELVVCGVADDVAGALGRWRSSGVLAIGPPVPDDSPGAPDVRLARLPRTVAAPALARAATAQACRGWGLAAQPRAELLASELVTHARRASDAAPYLRLDRLPDQLAISVTAYGPRVETLAAAQDPLGPLGVVAAVARTYGAAPRPGGCVLWATVSITARVLGEEVPAWREPN